MAQMTDYIECFCEECCENFKSYIAKDICPICEKLLSTSLPKFKPNYEKMQKSRKWRDD